MRVKLHTLDVSCCFSLTNARNVRLYYPYWQYTDLFTFQFVSLLCLRNTLRLKKWYAIQAIQPQIVKSIDEIITHTPYYLFEGVLFRRKERCVKTTHHFLECMMQNWTLLTKPFLHAILLLKNNCLVTFQPSPHNFVLMKRSSSWLQDCVKIYCCLSKLL